MPNRIEFDNLLFTQEAGAAIMGIMERLTAFSQVAGSGKEPDIWGEVESDGSLTVKMTVRTKSGGEVKGDLGIPADHWGYSQ